jgi:hypothetical protein
MKKMALVLMVVFLTVFFAVSAFAQDYPTRKVFAGKGEFQRFVNFKFQVPNGSCNQMETWQYIRYYGFGDRGHWEKKVPGTIATKGWYRFVNLDAGASCPSTKFSIEGNLDFLERMDGWYAMELEPEEIGLFVKGKWAENNFFGLSADDRQFSYHLVAPGDEVTTSLDIFFGEETNFIYMSGDPVGVIIADSRGFLKEIIWKKINKKGVIVNKDIVFSHDDIIVLIYKETYQ